MLQIIKFLKLCSTEIQNKVTFYRLLINPLRMWQHSSIWKQQ